MEKGSPETERDKMTVARLYPVYFNEAGRNGHLYDHSICVVAFGPCSYEEMEDLDASIWRYLYPYQVVEDIKGGKINAGNN